MTSFYYPPEAEENCNGCHMPLIESDDFGARVRDDSGVTKTFDHLFPSANTAVPLLAAEDGLVTQEQADRAVEAHRRFNEGVMRVDIFGLREGGEISGELYAPLRPEVPALTPGERYLLEVVVRTVKMGHHFTQGTSDSNQVWVELTAEDGRGETLGRSGWMDPETGQVDPWSHFLNSFVLDREGNRIARRNAQDIFTALYNHQIPPGAGEAIHYGLQVPEDAVGPVTVTARLRYRKFDTEIMRYVLEDPDWANDLPVIELAQDSVSFPVGETEPAIAEAPGFPLWQRWNDYGIGLLRKPGGAQLRQAEEAFKEVEALGRPDGPVNLARVYLAEGRVDRDAPEALRRARDFDPPAREWSVLWFTGLVNKQNGNLDEAIANLQQVVDGGFAQAAGRGFDFSKDWRLRIELAETLYERARQERGEARRSAREALLRRAVGHLEAALELDPEVARAHYIMEQVLIDLGDEEGAAVHAGLHRSYKMDDNARDVAVAAARAKYPAADVAAEAVVIYDLHRGNEQ